VSASNRERIGTVHAAASRAGRPPCTL